MRLAMIPPVVLLGVCLVFVPACKKKGDGGGIDPADATPAPGAVPASVNSGYFLFAHLNAKDIRDSAIFGEIKQAFAKAGGTAEWDKIEAGFSKEIGVKPTEIDSVTAILTEFADRGKPRFIVIVNATKAIPKVGVFGIPAKAKPDSRGFYAAGGDGFVHFPDDKTAVLLSEDLAQKYLDGYGKDRKGWPMTPELTKAASGHTAFAVIQMDKLPAEVRNDGGMKEFAPLMAAKTVTLTVDLKGKELSIAGRAVFPDATAAGKAKETVQKGIGMAVSEIEKFMNGKVPAEMTTFMPVVKEAHRALKETKVDVSGSDLTLAGRFKADFDITKMVTDAVKQVRETAPRITAQNNLKQIGLGLHNYASVWQDKIPVHAIGANGAPLKFGKDKPLLSWRVAILPYIEQDNLYKQFKLDEPWDSENNKKLIEKMPKIFASVGKEGKAGYTHLQMVIGPGGMTPGKYVIGNIPDGTSNTIAVIEAVDPVIWTKPDDVVLPAKLAAGDLKKKFGGQFPNGFNVLLWDGSVRFVRDTISEQTLGYALCPDDGQILGSDW